MAIENKARLFRRTCAGVGLLIGFLLACGVAGAAAPPAVTTDSVVTIPSDTTWGQVYKILFYKGNVLALDSGYNALYQLAPGATSWTTLVPPTGGVLGSSGGFTATGIAVDALGNLYIGFRFGVSGTSPTGSDFLRVPYDSVANTWHVAADDGWGSTIVDSVSYLSLSAGIDSIAFVDSPAKDGSGTLYWMSEDGQIYMLPVDNQGNADNPQPVATSLVSGLEASQGHIAIDVNGNVYFVENHATTNSGRASGIFFIPKGVNGITGSGGSAEAQLQRIDPSSNTIIYSGVTLDAAGNLYLTSEQNSTYDETVNGIWEIPNECGGPASVTSATCLNWNHTSLLSTFSGNNPLAIDPRGYLWVPTYHDPSADGSGAYPNVYAIVVLAPGSINLGGTPALTTGTSVPPGPTGTVFVNFNQAVTLSSTNVMQFAQAGTGTDFTTVGADPNPPATPPATPYGCTAGTAYTAQGSCELWIALNPREPGAISGQLTMLDTNNAYIPGSTVYISGTGQGAEVAMVNSPQQTAIAGAAAGLVTPAQVAVDASGNTYVADPGLKEVLSFSGGNANPVGTGLSDPTGVAVDGSGDIYIADNHKVIEIPATNGVAVAANQTTIATGLGTHLNLAVDGTGDVYVADPDNARVVKIVNPAAANLVPVFSPTTVTIGSGFSAPSAVAVDTSGDVFVADGTDLWEVASSNVMTKIATNLDEPVTGLAVDASGSVIVAQSGGLLRIPSINGILTINSASPLDASIQDPQSVAMDQLGDLYVSDMTNGTPSLFELSVDGAVNFGDALSPNDPAESYPALFDIGNMPLTVNGNSTFSGAGFDLSYLTAETDGTCDTTGQTPVAAGSSCTIGVQFEAPSLGTYTGDSMIVATNAGNVTSGNITATLAATVLNNLENTQTVVTLNPNTATYPGASTATVTITPEPGSSAPTTNVPSGTVTLTLTSTVVGSTQPPLVLTGQASGDDTGTTVTFNLSGIQGGTYSVSAAYAGSTAQLFKPSTSAAATFTVDPATPAINLSEPVGVSPNSANGVYYVQVNSQSGTKLNVTVAAPSGTTGTPSGTVTFTEGVGGTVLGSAQLDANGDASFNATSLPIGTYNIVANFVGDQNFGAVSSSVVTFQIIESSVLITANPASLSTAAGTPVASTLTLYSVAGFQASTGANITCDSTTLPYYAECTFSVPQPEFCAPPGTSTNPCSGMTTTVLTISTNIPVNLPPSSAANTAAHGGASLPLIPAGIFGLGIFGLAMRRKAIFSRKFLSGAGLSLIMLGVAMGLSSCNNNSYTHTPPPVTYTTANGTYNVSILVTNPASGAVQSLPFTIPVTITTAAQ